MSLYLKYRPIELSQIAGNEAEIKKLKGMFENDRSKWSHAYLLHGPTGCGKTTLARIIAHMLGAVKNDYIEVNTADDRGIDAIREIIRNTEYQPMQGAARVWVIDECHKLTNDAQNAFLKILEDTPKHAYFILCTTEPQKIIATIHSRCVKVQLRPLILRDTEKLVKRISKQEGVNLDYAVVQQIAKSSAGHPRMTLQILDQVLWVDESERLKIATQSEDLQYQTIDLCRALIDQSDWQKVREILKGLEDEDAEEIRRSLLGYCKSVLLNGENNNAAFVIQMLKEPLYNIGFPGLVFACYAITKNYTE